MHVAQVLFEQRIHIWPSRIVGCNGHGHGGWCACVVAQLVSAKFPKPLERWQRRIVRLAFLLHGADGLAHVGVAPDRALQPAHVAQAVFGAQAAACFRVDLFDRPVMRAVSSASKSMPRSASFTASDVGNAFASLGSIRATEVPLVAALKNLPRSSLEKSERLYSDRISGSTFFINFSFRTGDPSSTDDSNGT